MEIGDRRSATTACVTFITIFAFGNLLSTSNYNYICPYSHDITHGVVLTMAVIWCLMMYHRQARMIYIAGVGLALGLTFLTKGEIFLAGAAAIFTTLGLTIWLERPRWEQLFKLLGIFVGTALIPVITAFVLLCTVMPADNALQGTIGTWLWIGNKEYTSLSFFDRVMGTDYPWENIKKLLLWTISFLAIFAPTGLIAMALRKKGQSRIWMSVACFALTAMALWFNRGMVSWFDVARPLPLLMLALIVGSFVLFVKRDTENQLRRRLIVRLSMAIFAFTLLGKIILNARVCHYGFVLAMPSMLLLVLTLTCWIPNWISSRGGYGGFFRAVGLGVLLIYILAHLQIMSFLLSKKTCVVSEGADTFIATSRGYAVNLLLNQISQQVKSNETLVVLPEGIMVNYLCRRINPTPYVAFMPSELIMFGEDKMLASFKEHPPDYIALVHKDTSEYGFPFFGKDYGQRLFEWIKNNYNLIIQIGAPPLQDKHFGIQLMQAEESK
jgi:hypothetical protein